MFGEPGHLYVYFVYGMHWCANVVCGEASEASAVLLRAGEVLWGKEVARERRGGPRPDRELARGPANLAVALGITGDDSGLDLMGDGSEIRLRPRQAGAAAPDEIACGPRVGIRHAADRPWRWWIAGDPTVSRHPGVRIDRPR
jgi:DNA-3-methyladenine glycosylase